MTASAAYVAERLFDARHLILASDDPDEVVERCSRALRPHGLLLNGRNAKLAARLHHLPVGPLSLSRLCYGGDVTVMPALPQDGDFLITLPLEGRARFRSGTSAVELAPGRGTIVGPYQECRLDMDGAFDQILLRLDRRRVELTCAALAGREGTAPVHFDLALGDIPAFWHKLLEAAASLALFGGHAPAPPSLFVGLEELIVGALLAAQPNNFSAAIAAASRTPRAAQISKAMDYMRERLADPIRLGEVARHCGLSLRSLQSGFQRDVGLSPGRWLRAERLDRVHAVLANAAPGAVSVTDVALQWGFLHLGEFSAQFRDRFGRRPSEVLAKGPR